MLGYRFEAVITLSRGVPGFSVGRLHVIEEKSGQIFINDGDAVLLYIIDNVDFVRLRVARQCNPFTLWSSPILISEERLACETE